ncbi:MAG: CHASE2 domain-containing protein [Leptolyngbyaceae cyanobacterium RU_5_1]|nr:CHASE2 domain-containing protein [Leptolyngbyaceae cyanobacterium RU_5_1]
MVLGELREGRSRDRELFIALGISSLVFVLVISIRFAGWLQGAELDWYDRFMRWRPQELFEDRLVIIKVENTKYGWPLPDDVRVQLIDKLNQYYPRVIGFDIYREGKAGSPSQELINRLKQYNHVITICKVAESGRRDEPGVAAPTADLSPDQLGFSDVVTDWDNVLRRHLLVRGTHR